MAACLCFLGAELLQPRPSPFLGKKDRYVSKCPSGTLRSSSCSFVVRALFWGQKKTVDHYEMHFSLGSYSLSGSAPEGNLPSEIKPKKIFISVVPSIFEVSPKDWDACAVDVSGPEKLNPFLTHAFLSSLEESGCAVKEKGWVPCHIIAKDEDENIVGVVPLYLKSHSYGEFVFDHSWADAYYQYGAKYYPKLQCCVPFTPVTGHRILVRENWYKDQVFFMLVSAMKDLTSKLQVSSLHMTFSTENEWHQMKEAGFLQRIGMQYHWQNRNYMNFDEFLMDLKQNKRKNIRQERKKISAQNLTMKRLHGDEIKARHWDSFYKFYRNTTDNKWGRAFLTNEFFHNIGSKMGDQVLLVVAEDGDELIAGALNLIGGDTLYGRLWGCQPDAYYPSLHFEACYYQAIEAAIELKLKRVEAGAQGEHKMQRGYMPVMTYSCHYILDAGFGKAIGEFLVRETDQMKLVMKLLHDSGPFKEGIQVGGRLVSTFRAQSPKPIKSFIFSFQRSDVSIAWVGGSKNMEDKRPDLSVVKSSFLKNYQRLTLLDEKWSKGWFCKEARPLVQGK
ncbi:hypothetical protein H6P81_003335 [Aristolochia fimbriata]|uniref:Acyl-CoA N-acyltransferase n=1 Tax=Aristolochia fimbriata TaxID=158543 RepID=A0AAV7FC97_ARIFI|nr:hypothetical protein H6P81_003335 [Aristolochia fimbriata]